MGLSETAKMLSLSRFGYRNEGLSTGTYPINEIIQHETEELENTDIFDTCEELYGTRDVHSVIQDHFKKELEKDKDLIIWGLWFAREEDILKNYAEDDETEICSYKIPGDAIIISDLGEEGMLFAFTEHPDNIFDDSKIFANTISLATKHSQIEA